MTDFSFRTSHTHGSARLGWFQTPHGIVETPAFLPVGTHGAVRGLSMDEVAAAGGQMILSNAYHLYLLVRYCHRRHIHVKHGGYCGGVMS